MARRYELTDEDWQRVAPHLPPRTTRRGGRGFRDHRQVLDGILWRLHTGAQWREVPERYGSWKTVHNRFARWRDDGTPERICVTLQLELDDAGLIDHGRWLIDGTGVRAGRSAAGAARKKGATTMRTAAAASPTTTHSAARAAAGAASFTWSLTATAIHWPRR